MNRFCFIIVLVMGLASRSWAAASSGNDGQASPGASALVALEDLRSFAWWPLPPLQGAMRHENFREDIQSAIEDDLEDKDIDEAFLSLNPDFYIAYYAQVRGKIPGAFLVRWPATHKVGMQYPGDYWGPVYRPLAQPTPAAVLPGPAAPFPELVIDFIRASDRRVFWRGQAFLLLHPFHNKEEQIRPVVKQILDGYPGPKGTVTLP